jgi:serine/threonine protein kinase
MALRPALGLGGALVGAAMDSSERRKSKPPLDAERWAHAKAIFDAALDLGADSYNTLLNRECADDPQLLAEVRRLLKDFSEAPDFMESPAVLATVPRVAAFAPEQVVCGRFRILRLLGEGGMGEVYEAEDLTLGERIAIKTLRPDIAGGEAATARFRQELQLSRRVSHPNVCKVFELWEDETTLGGKNLFLTMELLEGQTIAQKIAADGPFSPAQALMLIRQIASGLDEIHQLGIVHRDLKPSNLHLVPQPGGQLRVIVTDFGLARSTRADSGLTQTGFVMGTPAYMAPEQFESGEATFASDIYSFGVTIFEMITGRRHPLVAPSSLAPGLKSAWDLAVKKTWDPEPDMRPARALDVVALIDRAQLGPRAKQIAAATAVVLVAASAVALLREPTPPQFQLNKVTNDDGVSWQPSLSADGETIAYSSDSSHRGDLDIWIRKADAASGTRVTDDPAHDSEPAISPDGGRIAFRSERTPAGIYLRDLSASSDRLIAPFGHNPVFAPDGRDLLFWTGNDAQFGGVRSHIYVASAHGVRQLVPGFADARHPAWSPDGRQIVFQGCGPDCRDAETETDWWIADREGSHPRATGALRKVLAQGLTLYLGPLSWQTGGLVFSARKTSDTNLWRIPLAHPWWPHSWAAAPLMSSTEEGIDPSVSASGNVAFVGLSSRINVFTVPLHGAAGVQSQGRIGNTEIDSSPSVSADGQKILYFRRQGNQRRIILRDPDGNELLNDTVAAGSRGFITAGGDALYYSIPMAGARKIVRRRQPAWKLEELCSDSSEVLDALTGGSALLVANRSGISALELSSCVETQLIGNGELIFDQAAVSPDGMWLALLGIRDSDHAGIFLRPLAGGRQAPLQPLTALDGWIDRPRWTRDGREIVFLSNRDRFQCIWAQAVGSRMRPAGEPRAVEHLHTIRVSPSHLSRIAFNLSVSSTGVVFNAGDISANIWLARPEK